MELEAPLGLLSVATSWSLGDAGFCSAAKGAGQGLVAQILTAFLLDSRLHTEVLPL